MCKEMISDYQSVLKRLITGDEIWIWAYDPERTDQSSEFRTKGEPGRQTDSQLLSLGDVNSFLRLPSF